MHGTTAKENLPCGFCGGFTLVYFNPSGVWLRCIRCGTFSPMEHHTMPLTRLVRTLWSGLRRRL
jgi:uncharacterized Zn finger protein